MSQPFLRQERPLLTEMIDTTKQRSITFEAGQLSSFIVAQSVLRFLSSWGLGTLRLGATIDGPGSHPQLHHQSCDIPLFVLLFPTSTQV